VRRALEAGRAELTVEPLRRLEAALPGHPGVNMLRQKAAVIGFNWPAQRGEYAPARKEPPSQADIDFVAFHANLAVAPSGIHQHFDYISVLALSFESAYLRAPKAKRILLTDENTPVPPEMKVDQVMRFPIDLTRLMYERMRIQTLYLQERPADRCSVMMDSDVIVNRDVAAIFAEDFDIGLTWRPEFPDAPFNGGVILVSRGSGGLQYLRSARSCYDALADSPSVAPLYPKDLRAWWGDQFALAVLVGFRHFADRSVAGSEIDGVRVRFFPCSDYNFTLEANVNYAPSFLTSKFFVHFKGNRKSMQSQYLAMMRANQI
jgi:hypothetical protein